MANSARALAGSRPFALPRRPRNAAAKLEVMARVQEAMKQKKQAAAQAAYERAQALAAQEYEQRVREMSQQSGEYIPVADDSMDLDQEQHQEPPQIPSSPAEDRMSRAVSVRSASVGSSGDMNIGSSGMDIGTSSGADLDSHSDDDWETTDDEALVEIQEDGQPAIDLEAEPDVDDIDVTLLPSGFDREELLRAIEYNERRDDDDDRDGVPIGLRPFDEVFAEFIEAAEQPAEEMLPETLNPADVQSIAVGGAYCPIRPPNIADLDDLSTLRPHAYNPNKPVSDFEMIMSMYIQSSGVSRTDYTAVREILGHLRCPNPDCLHFDKKLPQVQALPNQPDTLKNRLRARIPMVHMREADISLTVEKVATARASQKTKNMKSSEANIEVQKEVVSSKLYMIDPVSLFIALHKSEVVNSVHQGMAHFVDEPIELYQSISWASSIRTTAGEFAHIWYPPSETSTTGEDEPSDPVFPSDFVYFGCRDDSCICQQANLDLLELAHIGQVVAVGKDYRTNYCTDAKGEVALIVHELFMRRDRRVSGLKPANPEHIIPYNNIEEEDWDELEVVLVKADVYIRETDIFKLCNQEVHCDWFWKETRKDPNPRKALFEVLFPAEDPQGQGGAPGPKKKKTRARHFDKYTHRHKDIKPPIERSHRYFVRQAIVVEDIPFKQSYRLQSTPLCHTNPIRGQLELDAYGRAEFDRVWDRLSPFHKPVVSYPIMVFIDGFGLYRNAVRSLMGVYFTLAGLGFDARESQTNIYPITLGPHGSNFDDVVRALYSLGQLDKGMGVKFDGENGEESILCVPTLCYLGDMPQQAENSGMKGPRADKFCRYCMIGEQATKLNLQPPDGVPRPPNDVLNFDILAHGRYHYQTMLMRDEVDNRITGKKKREEYSTQWGIAENPPALLALTPALDIVCSRPSDPAHSEMKGLSYQMHLTLLDGILTEKSGKEYTRVLRHWPFPPGWQKFHSPFHHLDSWTLADHARWSVIIPALLRAWLKAHHIDPWVYKVMRREVANIDIEEDPHDDNEEVIQLILDTIVHAFTAMAKSNSLLMGVKVTAQDRRDFMGHIMQAREPYKMLCGVVSDAIALNPKSYKAPKRPGGKRGDKAKMARQRGRLAPEADDTEVEDNESKRANQYFNAQSRPNVHIAVHYPAVMKEYALPVNTNVLPFEIYHRWAKDRATKTNATNPEKTILEMAAFHITMRLAMRKAFADTDGELTRQLFELQKSCPTVFDAFISRIDQQEIKAAENDMVFDVEMDADYEHRRPTVGGQLPNSIVNQSRHAANANQLLPRAEREMRSRFKDLLFRAYWYDYGVRLLAFGNKVLQWSQRVAFTDSLDRRHVLSQGHYVKFIHSEPAHHNGDIYETRIVERKRIGRIDHIFLQEIAGDRRYIFLLLTRVKVSSKRDEVLDLPYVEDVEPVIVGLTAIRPQKLYIVPLEDPLKEDTSNMNKTGGKPVFVNWQVEWL